MRQEMETQAQIFRQVLAVTAISTISSFVLSLLAMHIFYCGDSNLKISAAEFQNFGLTLSILLPILICPPVCYQSAKLVHDLRRARSELQIIAHTDKLTGVLNRRGFDKAAQASLEAARNAGHPTSVLVCDIDHFKRLNDGFGHDFGDRTLMHVADILGSFAQSHNFVVGRQGGDEFVMMLPGTVLAQAAAIAESIRIACGKITLGGEEADASLSVSIGVAASAQSGTSLSALIRRADVALYDVKRTGRNSVVAADVQEQWASAA
jgi:diguanylate cyclase (GGDEF)-like protein